MSGPPLDGYDPPRRRFPRATAPRGDGKPKCDHCGNPVRWALPVIPRRKGPPPAYANKAKPFDYEPDASGRFALHEKDGRTYYAELRRGQVAGWQEAGNPTYMPHFQSCAKKDQWGQRGKSYGSGSVTR